jgi:pyruvate formate lyase activating enzyme
MTDRGPTPVATLEKIYAKAKELGLLFPYIGNVSRHDGENTVCPACGTTLIERSGFSSRFVDLDGQQCRKCGEKIGIVTHVS